jgi:hypothetical protein
MAMKGLLPTATDKLGLHLTLGLMMKDLATVRQMYRQGLILGFEP